LNVIRNEYDDIIKEILPNYMMGNIDFKKVNDIKAIKNYLKKSFKRLGLIDDVMK